MKFQFPKNRLEAFSDGVFAIAITLLVLEIHVPEGEESLAHRLAEIWPQYVSFVISFFVIGVMWVNHHRMLHDIRAVDHGLLICNLVVLMTVTIIPFTTSLAGEEITHGSFADERTAAILYALGFVLFGLAFSLMWWWAARDRHLLEADVPEFQIQARLRGMLLGTVLYLGAAAVAFASPLASLILDGVLAAAFLMPATVMVKVTGPSPSRRPG
ncbi:TMEM175 family protein [Streptomyces sp. NPDC047023]|uniref:TMEM175 family protein n=1 Tax=Streptomyces sp. NPDC047023 TaxID=3155139 RepID=UPI0033DBE3DC